jgi:hypothetical protein
LAPIWYLHAAVSTPWACPKPTCTGVRAVGWSICLHALRAQWHCAIVT